MASASNLYIATARIDGACTHPGDDSKVKETLKRQLDSENTPSHDSDEEKNVYHHAQSEPAIESDFDSEVLSEDKLAHETLKMIKLDFSTILTTICQSLKRREVSVDDVLGHLRSIEAVGPNFESVFVDYPKPLKVVAQQKFKSAILLLVQPFDYRKYHGNIL